jgi:hypothetical protein
MDIDLTWLTLAKTGLILNTVGALILVLASNKILDVLTKFVDTVGPTYGTYGQGRAAPQIKRLAKEFIKVKRKALITNFVGYTFFVLGFILQLF